MHSSRIFLIASLMVALAAGCTTTKDIAFMKQLANDEEAKKEMLEADTKNYEKLKEALNEGKLEIGMLEQDVRKRFGEPVIETQEKNESRLAYKPGPASWFGGQKIYLFFDSDGKLTRFQAPQAEKAAA